MTLKIINHILIVSWGSKIGSLLGCWDLLTWVELGTWDLGLGSWDPIWTGPLAFQLSMNNIYVHLKFRRQTLMILFLALSLSLLGLYSIGHLHACPLFCFGYKIECFDHPRFCPIIIHISMSVMDVGESRHASMRPSLLVLTLSQNKCVFSLTSRQSLEWWSYIWTIIHIFIQMWTCSSIF
jgi:hypothetical protein